MCFPAAPWALTGVSAIVALSLIPDAWPLSAPPHFTMDLSKNPSDRWLGAVDMVRLLQAATNRFYLFLTGWRVFLCFLRPASC